MLGALEGDTEDASLVTATPHDPSAGSRQRTTERRRKKSAAPRDHHDGIREAEPPAPTVTDNTSIDDPLSLTDVDVTPLPSDEPPSMSLDQPLTVADLFKSKTWSPGTRTTTTNRGSAGSNVRGALQELKTLENNSQAPRSQVHFEQQAQLQPQSRPFAGRGGTPPGGKENAPVGGQVQGHGGQLQGQQQQQQQQRQQAVTNHKPPTAGGLTPLSGCIPDTGQPFARVFHMLKQMNPNLGGNQPVPAGGDRRPACPPLLHIAPPGGSGGASLRFPPIPGTFAPVAPPGNSRSALRMPLLQLYTPHRTDEVPVHDVTSQLPDAVHLRHHVPRYPPPASDAPPPR